MHRIRVARPEIQGHEALFSWSCVPQTGFYRRQSFRLRYPEGIELGKVPEALWWTVALLCLHPHWLLLRPCRIDLPVTLGPGEREFWLRLIDAGAQTLEAYRGGSDRRRVEISESGPALDAVTLTDAGTVATAFSGGKDSLLQLALLADCGEETIAVTTTSPLDGMHDHLTARRRHVISEIVRRRRVEHVEVTSDMRPCAENLEPLGRGYPVAVSEVTDTFLYVAAMLPVAWLRGAGRVLLASEAEVQESAEVNGRIVQHPHFMYSAATQRAVGALLERHGIALGSLTYPLRSGQVQRLLWTRYRDLRDLQYSCWRVGENEATCSRCSQCLRIAMTALATGGSPAEIGIDLPGLLLAMRDWSPSPPAGTGLPDDRVKADLRAQIARDLASVPPARVARALPPRRSGVRALGAYRDLRERVAGSAQARTPAPGFRSGYLPLVEPRLRERVGRIYDSSFERGPVEADAPLVRRTLALSDWVAEPLAS